MSKFSYKAAACLLDPERLSEVSELFKAMGEPTRLGLLCLLLEGEQSVGAMAGRLGGSPSAISHQLRLLRSLHLVKTRRAGQHIFYCLADEHVASLVRVAWEHVEEPRHGL
ncbi:MAG: helix-turn-helix transcriptional regulator [Candidatus Riflebacteria bacterium]|nr:helix-turn-helix transcriptional regulator [Candidatus Riflebacteria bacterium]